MIKYTSVLLSRCCREFWPGGNLACARLYLMPTPLSPGRNISRNIVPSPAVISARVPKLRIITGFSIFKHFLRRVGNIEQTCRPLLRRLAAPIVTGGCGYIGVAHKALYG